MKVTLSFRIAVAETVGVAMTIGLLPSSINQRNKYVVDYR